MESEPVRGVYKVSTGELQTLADEDLMKSFAATDAHEFLDELLDRHYGRVLAGINAVLRDHGDAEDMAQETFVRVFTHAGQFNGGSFRGWLFRIARNLALDRVQEKRRSPVTLPADVTGSDSQELARFTEVEQVLAQLSRPQRICLRLLYEKGLSYREIAADTGYSEKAVKAHVQNGRERFKRLWEKKPAKGVCA